MFYFIMLSSIFRKSQYIFNDLFSFTTSTSEYLMVEFKTICKMLLQDKYTNQLLILIIVLTFVPIIL